MPPYALIVAAIVLSVIAAVCIVLSRRAPRPEVATKVRPPYIRFIGEQDGPRERTLKDALAKFFQLDGIVQRAYLARVDIGEGRTVSLCLKASPLPDESYPDRISQLFIQVMGPGGFLHILFIRDDQETDLARVCEPFYDSSQGPAWPRA